MEAFTDNQSLAERFDAQFLPTEWFIEVVPHNQGAPSRAIEIFESVRPLFEQAPFYLGSFGHAYAADGRLEDANEILTTLKAHEQRGLALSYDIANIELALGNIDRTFHRLELALKKRDFSIGMIGVDPIGEPLRSDPRFKELISPHRSSTRQEIYCIFW